MSLFTKLARNSLWLLIARVGAQVCMVIVTYLLARRLGVAGFGEYAFIAAAIVIGNALTTFGSDMVLIREIAAKSEYSDLPPALALQILLSILFIVAVYLIAPLLPNQTPESILAIKIYSFALIPLAFYTVFTSALRGMQKMTTYAWLNLVIPLIQVIAIYVFIQQETSLVMLAFLLLIIQIVGAIVGGILCFVTMPGFLKNVRFSLDKTISLFVVCLPIALIAILGIVYQKLSLTMLSFLDTTSMVGLFSAAARVSEAMRMGHFSAFTALYPAMANAKDKDDAKTFRSSWLLLLGVACGGSVLIFLLAEPLVNVLFGLDYLLSVPVLKILSFTLIPYTINTYLSLLFLARKKEKIVLGIYIISLLILFILNILLIPPMGQVGAGWAILTSEVMQAILFLFAWGTNPQIIHSQGASYELSELSR